jgi:hypothetical protein
MRSAIAVIAFSPPDRSWRCWRRFPRRLHEDVDPGLEQILVVGEGQPRRPAAHELGVGLLERVVHAVERVAKPLPAHAVRLRDGVAQRRDGRLEIRHLRRQTAAPLVELGVGPPARRG